mmetsp:Transcript_59008/g.161829  ORF Transcript_59008/g.161829 Transcript_59008/m.161829 type:complete len:83 (-) Transcript_59008:432-680(-)
MVAERDEMDVRAACGHTGPVRSFHSWTASGCKKDVHDSIICNKMWEPIEMTYFCSEAESCIQQSTNKQQRKMVRTTKRTTKR